MDSKWLFITFLVGSLLLDLTWAQAGPRVTFVHITKDQSFSAPQPNESLDHLGLLIRGLPKDQLAKLAVFKLHDANGDGLLQPLERKEVWSRGPENLSAKLRQIRPGQYIVKLPDLSGENADQLEAELQDPNDKWLARPTQLTIKRANGKRYRALGWLAEVSSNAFNRLLRIYDIIRFKGEVQGTIYVLDLDSGKPSGLARSLELEAINVSSLVLSPGGERVAWVGRPAGSFELWVADVTSSNARIIIKRTGQITSVRFLDNLHIVAALGKTITIFDLNDGQTQNYLLPVKSIRELYYVRPLGDGLEATLSAEMGDPGGPGIRLPFLAKLGTKGKIELLRLPSHELYSVIPHTHPAGKVYFSFKVRNGVRLTYMDLHDETIHEVATCGEIGPLALADNGTRLSWVGSECKGEAQ